ncbi:MAG: hypothetical protein H9W83_04260 [Leuconostoc sp.]|nr:hypothetical protein [Leuconostoc sp.]
MVCPNDWRDDEEEAFAVVAGFDVVAGFGVVLVLDVVFAVVFAVVDGAGASALTVSQFVTVTGGTHSLLSSPNGCSFPKFP